MSFIDNDTFDPGSYWQDRLANDLSLASVGHTGLGLAYNRWLYRVRRYAFLRCIADLIDRPDRLSVLDVGSGTGFYLRLWTGLGVRHLMGADFTDVVVDSLRDVYGRDHVLKLDIGAACPEYALRSFDVVSIMDVLFHVVDDRRYAQAFMNISALLRPGGLVILTERLSSQRRQTNVHVVTRTVTEVNAAARASGLDLLTCRPAFCLMEEPIDSRSRIHRLQWRVTAAVVKRDEILGHLAGMSLYPLEITLLRLGRYMPSLRLLVYRKRTESDDKMEVQ